MSDVPEQVPLRKPISTRFTEEQHDVIEAWKRHMAESSMGMRPTSADALRALVSIAAQTPEVKKAVGGR